VAVSCEHNNELSVSIEDTGCVDWLSDSQLPKEKHEDYYLAGCDAVYFSRWVPEYMVSHSGRRYCS
jgi:hypothetical protein